MHAFDVLGDPVRRRILELLAEGEQPSGALGTVIQAEFGISQPAVSQHLRVLREAGFASVRAEGPRRLYAVDTAPLREVDTWLEQFRAFWEQPPKDDAGRGSARSPLTAWLRPPPWPPSDPSR